MYLVLLYLCISVLLWLLPSTCDLSPGLQIKHKDAFVVHCSALHSHLLGHSIAMETSNPRAPDSPEAKASRDQQVMSPTPPGFETPEQIELKRRLVGKQNPRRGGPRARSSNEGGDGVTLSGQGAQVKALTDMVFQLQEQ